MSESVLGRAIGAALDEAGLAPIGCRLAVGFSGGLDSTVLLHAVCAFARSAGLAPPLAVHVHHGLQAAADDWARDCGARATDLGASFMLHRV
ncbi:MAG: tRNA(Ile)-lysidine synthetase, partial [Betaproteobacteria bacterium]|nr:tRNA(Ile)-lysidine synthetase [Betaproteobacteria bacterium]